MSGEAYLGQLPHGEGAQCPAQLAELGEHGQEPPEVLPGIRVQGEEAQSRGGLGEKKGREGGAQSLGEGGLSGLRGEEQKMTHSNTCDRHARRGADQHIVP